VADVGDIENQHPRPTTASIDRRVERLEQAQTEMDRKVAALDVKVDYLKELMTLRFSALEASISVQGSKLDTFMAKIESLIQEGMKQQGDLDASALGRSINKRITALEEGEEKHEVLLHQFQGFSALIRFYLLPIAAIAISLWAAFSTQAPK
jgi:hypothetical protein